MGKVRMNLDSRTRDALKRFGAVELVVLGARYGIFLVRFWVGFRVRLCVLDMLRSLF